MKNELIAANGSVQALDVPQEVKDLYKTYLSCDTI